MNFRKLILLIILFTVQFNVTGQIVLTLDNIPPAIQSGEVWTEENIDIHIDGSFGIQPTSVWLWPATIVVDLTPLQNINMIEIDVHDGCGVNCTTALILDAIGVVVDDNGNLTNMMETLTLFNATEESLTELNISSSEGEILEIRIFQNALSLNSVHTPSDSLPFCYPNPGAAVDDLHFTIGKDSKWSFLESIDIFTINGELVYNKEISAFEISNGFIISAEDLPTGILIVRYKLGNLFIPQKIVRL